MTAVLTRPTSIAGNGRVKGDDTVTMRSLYRRRSPYTVHSDMNVKEKGERGEEGHSE